MNEALRQILIGAGSLFFGPPEPCTRVTHYPKSDMDAIAGDFNRVVTDLKHAMDKVEKGVVDSPKE